VILFLKILAIASIIWLCVLALWIWAVCDRYSCPDRHQERDGDFY
jgi:hypothetical protein